LIIIIIIISSWLHHQFGFLEFNMSDHSVITIFSFVVIVVMSSLRRNFISGIIQFKMKAGGTPLIYGTQVSPP